MRRGWNSFYDKYLRYALILIPRLLREIVFKSSPFIKSDSLYLKIVYFLTFFKWLDLEHPETLLTFNEKIQWLKMHNNTQLHTQMVDKYEVRSLIKEKLGTGYTFPLLGVWNDPDEIDFDMLPDPFVLKPTHDSGSIIFCHDKSHFNQNAARKKLRKALKRNYYWLGREAPYKNVKPRIIAEPLMVDESGVELKDYKLFCFDGIVRMIQVHFDRFNKHHQNLYTPEWKLIDGYLSSYPSGRQEAVPRPYILDDMVQKASMLSKGFPFVRVDFYIINNKLYFGEFTFHHAGGLARVYPRTFARQLGDWISLPIS